ncbi:MAG: hypothetical protein ACPGXK_14355, partial [Phycisphaerae bacterium]
MSSKARSKDILAQLAVIVMAGLFVPTLSLFLCYTPLFYRPRTGPWYERLSAIPLLAIFLIPLYMLSFFGARHF